LLQLKQGPKYGYEILKEMRKEFEGLWNIETGTFYPALKSLEKRGFIDTEVKDDTTYYHITEQGNKMFESYGNHLTDQFEISEQFFDTTLNWLPRSFIELMFNLFSKKFLKRRGMIYRLPVFLQHIPHEKKLVFLDELRQRMTDEIIFIEEYIEEVKNGE
jgi:DNA-binding PadR family transcriptional regulator